MEFDAVPASRFAVPDLVQLLNRGFEEYCIPIQFNSEMFSDMLRKDGIALADSRVLIANDQACGIALIACRRRLRSSRVAAMGIVKETRGQGAGSWFMKELIEDAAERGDREMVLEVIEQNEPAFKLYRKYGFACRRRLVGFTCRFKGKRDIERGDLAEVDLRDMGRLISQYGLPDLPWQLSEESIIQMNPPPHAYRDGPAYIVISNPEADHVIIWSLLVEPAARGKGLGAKMLRSVMARRTGKTWHVPAIFPEELGQAFDRAGFEKETLSQWQMKLSLKD